MNDTNIALDVTDLPTLRRIVKLMDYLLEGYKDDDIMVRLGPSYAAKFFRRIVTELEVRERTN